MNSEQSWMDPTIGRFRHYRSTRIRRQQGGESIIICAGIINDQIVGVVRVLEGITLNFSGLLQPPWVSVVEFT